jgi:hypothetical protein
MRGSYFKNATLLACERKLAAVPYNESQLLEMMIGGSVKDKIF